MEQIKFYFEIGAAAATIISLLGIFFTYLFSRKQIYFDAMNKCISEFRDLNISQVSDEKTIQRYIELVSEELFYFQNKYIPKIVAVEWIDGMIDYFPFITDKTIVNGKHSKKCLQELNSLEKIETYISSENPRVKKLITLFKEYNWEMIYTKDNYKDRFKERAKLIKEIMKNLGILKWHSFNLKMRINSLY